MLPQAAPAGEVFFSKRYYVTDNTSYLCMLETSVFRKLLKSNNFTGLEKMDWNKRIVEFYAKSGILENGFSVLNILLSITAFLGNALILVAIRREFLQRPSKLLCDERFSVLTGLLQTTWQRKQKLVAVSWYTKTCFKRACYGRQGLDSVWFHSRFFSVHVDNRHKLLM